MLRAAAYQFPLWDFLSVIPELFQPMNLMHHMEANPSWVPLLQHPSHWLTLTCYSQITLEAVLFPFSKGLKYWNALKICTSITINFPSPLPILFDHPHVSIKHVRIAFLLIWCCMDIPLHVFGHSFLQLSKNIRAFEQAQVVVTQICVQMENDFVKISGNILQRSFKNDTIHNI